MAALTTDEKMTVFAILEVPWAGAVIRVMDDGMRAQMLVDGKLTINEAAADDLLSFLTNTVDNDATLSARVKSLLDAWDALGNDTSTVGNTQNNGVVGNLGGVVYSPWKKREWIRQQLQIFVPFMRRQDFYVSQRMQMSETNRSINASIVR